MSSQPPDPAQDDVVWPTDAGTHASASRDNTFEWPMDVNAITSVRADVMMLLYLFQDKWIHRRVDAIKFDQNEACWYESIDFQLPQKVLTVLGYKPNVKTTDEDGVELQTKQITEPVFVPIAVLHKDPLAKLDIWDEAGNRLCTLTRRQNEGFSQFLLERMATIVLGETLEEVVKRGFNKFVRATNRGEASRALMDFWRCSPQARDIWGHRVMKDLIFSTVSSRPMFVPVKLTDNRQLVKFSYASPTTFDLKPFKWQKRTRERPTHRSRWRALFKRAQLSLTWWEQSRLFSMSGALLSDSFHWEIAPPEGFEFKSVSVVRPDYDGSGILRRVPASGAVYPTRANIYMSQSSNPPTRNMLIECKLRLPRHGLLNSAWLSTLLTAVALVVVGLCAPHLTNRQGQTGAGVAALLAVSQLSNLYLGRPGEHRSYNKMILGLRCLLMLSALAGLGGVTLLLTWDDKFYPWWGVMTALAIIAFLGVWVGRDLTGQDHNATIRFPRLAIDVKYPLIIIAVVMAAATLHGGHVWWLVASWTSMALLATVTVRRLLADMRRHAYEDGLRTALRGMGVRR